MYSMLTLYGTLEGYQILKIWKKFRREQQNEFMD